MGNSCNISHPMGINSLKPSPYPSLTFPQTPEFLDNLQSHYKGDFLSQINYYSVPTSTASLPTLNVLKFSKKTIYSLNRRNLRKAIQHQVSPSLSPLRREGLRSIRNPGVQKDKLSKESSFWKYNPSSFHTSVSEILDDGCMEYSRDSESLKVEDLWQDVSKTVNNNLQQIVDSRASPNLEDRRRSDSYLLIQDKYSARTIEDKRRGSIETPQLENSSPVRKNFKKDEVRMLQARLEKEDGMNKMSLFSEKREETLIPQTKENCNIKLFTSQLIQEIEISDQSPMQDNKETRIIQGLTTVAQSFSPIKKSNNASPDDKRSILNGFEDNPFREEKSLYSESVSPFDASLTKTPNDSPNQAGKEKNYYHSVSKDMHSGSKSLIKYCSVGALESNVITELYEGVQNLEKNIQEYSRNTRQKHLIEQRKSSNLDYKQVTNRLSPDIERKTTSIHNILHKSHTNENVPATHSQRNREVVARKGSLMDRLMESLLEENTRKNDNSYILDTSEKGSPSLDASRDASEKERRRVRTASLVQGGRRKSQFAIDQADNAPKRKEEELKNRDLDNAGVKETMNAQLQTRSGELGKTAGAANNTAVSSVYMSRRNSPLLKPEAPEPSPERSSNQREENSKMLQVDEKGAQKEKGEIVTDQKAVLEEIKNLQREVFERMSVVTTSVNGTLLTPKKMLDLKDIQDKIQILTQLSSLIETGGVVSESQKPESMMKSSSSAKPVQRNDKKIIKKIAQVPEKSNKSINKEETRYSSCSKPSVPQSSIKRNSSLSDINSANKSVQSISNVPVQIVKPQGHVLKVTKTPSDSLSTQEFLQTEIECTNNPKEVWLRQSRNNPNRKSLQNLSWTGESKGHQKFVEVDLEKEVSCYEQISEAKRRKAAELLTKSYLTNDISAEKYSSVSLNMLALPEQEVSGQSQLVENANINGLQNVIKKLSRPKNLSTYVLPAQSQPKEDMRPLSMEKSKGTASVKSIKQSNVATRRQPVIGEKGEDKKVNVSYNASNTKGQVNSIEKIKPPVQDRQVNKNEKAVQAKNQAIQKRLSVGSSSNVSKDYVKSIIESRKKSPSPIKYTENEKKRRISQVSQSQENVENIPEVEIAIEDLMNNSTNENNETEMLYEEITRLNQKLAVAKSNSKINILEGMVQKSPIKQTRVIDPSREKKNQERSYTKQAIKKTEKNLAPLVARATRQNSSQSSDVQERKVTAGILDFSVQQEQQDTYTVTESCGGDAKKAKYDYNQAMQMRVKYAEEAARRQSIAESTEWILNAKLPLPATKNQEKAKKNHVSIQ